jgi:hypothetical protein
MGLLLQYIIYGEDVGRGTTPLTYTFPSTSDPRTRLKTRKAYSLVGSFLPLWA